MNNCALYVVDPTLISSKVLNSLPAITSYSSKNEGDAATGIILELDCATIECNFMPSEEIPSHLQGLLGFISHYKVPNADDIYIRSRMSNVNLIIGCVITPGFDQAGKVADFIRDFCYATRAMLFFGNGLWDFDGECLALQEL